MSISNVSNSSNYVVPKLPTARKSELDMEAFLKLLTVQLANQNPLEPMNDRDFFAQMAQLGQVQGMDQLNKQAQLEQAQNLMGKEVTAVRPMTDSNTGENELVTGVVSKLNVRNGQYYVGIKEADGGIVEVQMNNIQAVTPQRSVSDYLPLVGRQVSGSIVNGTVTTAIAGEVKGVETKDGQIVLRVQDGSGKVQTLPLERLESVS